MKKNLLFVFLFTCMSGVYSQNSFNFRFDTHNTNLENEEVLIRKNLLLTIKDTLLSKSKNNMGATNLNFRVEEDGAITFIKGHKGFSKINIPEEFVGIQIPYYEDDNIIDAMNKLFSGLKLVHSINSQKQADCKKLKNVIFYGEVKVTTLKQL